MEQSLGRYLLEVRPCGHIASRCDQEEGISFSVHFSPIFVGKGLIDSYQRAARRLVSRKMNSHRYANQFVHTT